MTNNHYGYGDIFPSCTDDDCKILRSFSNQKERMMHCFTRMDDSIYNYSKHALTTMCYHYTNVESFKKIFSSNKIRLSLYNEMRNDTQEAKYILEGFINACTELLYEGQISESEYELLKKMKLHFRQCFFFDSNGRYETAEYDPYIMSFSCTEVNSDLWLRYTCDENSNVDNGMCFTLPVYNLDHYNLKDKFFCRCFETISFERVYYGDEMLKTQFKINIIFLKKVLDDFGDIIEVISHQLSRIRLAVKRTNNGTIDYTVENEVRMIVHIPKDKGLIKEIWDYYEEKEEGGRMYLYMDISKIKGHINVFLSPHCNMSAEEIKDYLRNNGWNADVLDPYQKNI